MNAYRVSGKVSADRTITVRVPEAFVGDDAEAIVLFPQSRPEPVEEHPLRRFLDELRSRPIDPEGAARAEAEQAFLRELRDEWNRSTLTVR